MDGLDTMAQNNRLIVGLLFSLAVHGLLIVGLRPMTAPYPVPASLQVELLGAPPASTAAVAVSARSDHSTRLESLPTAESAKVERQQLNTGTEPAAGPNLRLTPDRYYTSRELDVRAEPINEVPLVYPRLAYQNRISGKVTLRILINERGGIDQVSVLAAEPRGVFEEAALAAAQPLRFSPAIRNLQPVKSQKVIEVAFDPYESIHIP